MTNPHVEWLEYGLKTGWLFDNPPPLEWQTPVFSAHLIDGIFRVEPLDHFATVQDARAAIEPFLQTWEIDLALKYGQRPMTFEFKEAHIVDRYPPPPGAAITITGTASMTFSSSGTGDVTLKAYPAVPINFEATPDVITLWTRFEGFKKGQEPLCSDGLFLLYVPQGPLPRLAE